MKKETINSVFSRNGRAMDRMEKCMIERRREDGRGSGVSFNLLP